MKTVRGPLFDETTLQFALVPRAAEEPKVIASNLGVADAAAKLVEVPRDVDGGVGTASYGRASTGTLAGQKRLPISCAAIGAYMPRSPVPKPTGMSMVGADAKLLANAWNLMSLAFISGPVGSGKLALLRELAALNESPYTRVDLAEGSNARELLLGGWTLTRASSKQVMAAPEWVPGPLNKAIENGEALVIHVRFDLSSPAGEELAKVLTEVFDSNGNFRIKREREDQKPEEVTVNRHANTRVFVVFTDRPKSEGRPDLSRLEGLRWPHVKLDD